VQFPEVAQHNVAPLPQQDKQNKVSSVHAAAQALCAPILAKLPLDGSWLQKNGDIVLIKMQHVYWSYCGERDPITILSSKSIAMCLDGNTHVATVSSHCSMMVWSDGDVWNRVHACYLPTIEEECMDLSSGKSDCGESTCSTLDTLDMSDESDIGNNSWVSSPTSEDSTFVEPAEDTHSLNGTCVVRWDRCLRQLPTH